MTLDPTPSSQQLPRLVIRNASAGALWLRWLIATAFALGISFLISFKPLPTTISTFDVVGLLTLAILALLALRVRPVARYLAWGSGGNYVIYYSVRAFGVILAILIGVKGIHYYDPANLFVNGSAVILLGMASIIPNHSSYEAFLRYLEGPPPKSITPKPAPAPAQISEKQAKIGIWLFWGFFLGFACLILTFHSNKDLPMAGESASILELFCAGLVLFAAYLISFGPHFAKEKLAPYPRAFVSQWLLIPNAVLLACFAAESFRWPHFRWALMALVVVAFILVMPTKARQKALAEARKADLASKESNQAQVSLPEPSAKELWIWWSIPVSIVLSLLALSGVRFLENPPKNVLTSGMPLAVLMCLPFFLIAYFYPRFFAKRYKENYREYLFGCWLMAYWPTLMGLLTAQIAGSGGERAMLPCIVFALALLLKTIPLPRMHRAFLRYGASQD